MSQNGQGQSRPASSRNGAGSSRNGAGSSRNGDGNGNVPERWDSRESMSTTTDVSISAPMDHPPKSQKDKKRKGQEISGVVRGELEIGNLVDSSLELLAACRKEQWKTVMSLLDEPQNFDLNFTDKAGCTPLMCAAKSDKNLSVAQRLIDVGADMSAANKEGRAAVHIAAKFGSINILRLMLKRDATLALIQGPGGHLPLHDVSNQKENVLEVLMYLVEITTDGSRTGRFMTDGHGCLPIHLAIEAANFDSMRLLLAKDCQEQLDMRRADGHVQAIHIACQTGNPNVLKFILEAGKHDVNSQDIDGRTPLHYTSMKRQHEMMMLLHAYAADANISDVMGRSPLYEAVNAGDMNLVELLIAKFRANPMTRTENGSTLLHLAAGIGDPKACQTFMKYGVPLHMPNRMGNTALHEAASRGHVNVIKALISFGARIDLINKENFTALHVAVQSGRPDAIDCLVGNGARVNDPGGSNEQTPLHFAVGLSGETATKCVDILLKSGAEINDKQQDGQTVMHISGQRGLPDMLKLLMANGADPTLTDNHDETPVHACVRGCHRAALELLLTEMSDKNGPEVVSKLINRVTDNGETVVHIAAQIPPETLHEFGEDASIMSLLLEYGANVNIPTSKTRETVMHFIARNGNEPAMAVMCNKLGEERLQLTINTLTKTNTTPLLEACAAGHEKQVATLLSNNARVDAFDTEGFTALHFAALGGHIGVCQRLLENKAFLQSRNRAGETALHLAAKNGHDKLIMLLVRKHKATLELMTMTDLTPLHYAAMSGQLRATQALLALGAKPSSIDLQGQTPLHLAATNDYPDVVKVFLDLKNGRKTVLTAVDHNGFTCAHIAAMKGSLSVVKELVAIDRDMAITAATKLTDSTTLHMAAAGGHKPIVQFLLKRGADKAKEDSAGMTAAHLAAKHGHLSILECFDKTEWSETSIKNGMNLAHVAAYYGQTDFILELINKDVNINAKTTRGCTGNPLLPKSFGHENGLTALHMASQAGNHELIRIIMNMGVDVTASSSTMAMTPLHIAAFAGHESVAGLILSRSSDQVQAKTSMGRTPLHLAAINGHVTMCAFLLAQGSTVNAMDQNGWTVLHFAAKAGHLELLKLFMTSGADAEAETKDNRTALLLAAQHTQQDCLYYLIEQKHDSSALLKDKEFFSSMMICGKADENRVIEKFIMKSKAPIDTAIKLASIYKIASVKDKERSKDLEEANVFCEQISLDLLSVIAGEYDAALLLNAHDDNNKQFLDILIDNDQRVVVAHPSVQSYLTLIWNGGYDWSMGKLTLLFFTMLCFPPLWMVLSLPLKYKITRAPVVKFNCNLVSHVYFTILQSAVSLGLFIDIYEYRINDPLPHWLELLLTFWMAGMLVAELSMSGRRSGLGGIRLVMISLSTIGMCLHVVAYVWAWSAEKEQDKLYYLYTILYIKKQTLAFVLSFTFIQYLDFLQAHYMFGPLAITIRDLIFDLVRFLVILVLFIVGFGLHITAISQKAYPEGLFLTEGKNSSEPYESNPAQNPGHALDSMVFAMFGMVDMEDVLPSSGVPVSLAAMIMKVVMSIYMMVSTIVLINLLIAMMSDTYARIQEAADIEWKFGRIILIRQINKNGAVPVPMNIIAKTYVIISTLMSQRTLVLTTSSQRELRQVQDAELFSIHALEADGVHNDDPVAQARNLIVANKKKWKIDQIIDWRRVVNLYFVQQGRHEEADEDFLDLHADSATVTTDAS